MKKCPACLKENADDAIQCEQCGVGINTMLQRMDGSLPEPVEQPAQEPKKPNIPLRVGWLLFAGSFIVQKAISNQESITSRYRSRGADIWGHTDPWARADDWGTIDYSWFVVIMWLMRIGGFSLLFFGFSKLVLNLTKKNANNDAPAQTGE